jgi:hypothetical protein
MDMIIGMGVDIGLIMGDEGEMNKKKIKIKIKIKVCSSLKIGEKREQRKYNRERKGNYK